MTRSDLIELFTLKTDVTIPVAEAIVHEIFGGMSEALIAGDRIEIRGFGSFEIREYEGYIGRNPTTGVETTVKPKKSPFFKVGKDLKERIMSSTPV